MAGELSGRVALVVGASSGLGRATALGLAQAGADVAVSARREDRLKELLGEIEATGRRGLALPGDCTDEAVATRVVEDTLQHFGRIDILVNSAGIIRPGGVVDASTDEWRQVMDVNLMGSLYTCRAVAEAMKAQGGGDIINISSPGRRRAAKAFGSYSASKVALNYMTDVVRQELGPHGIRVCVIEPGPTTSEVWDSIPDPEVRKFMHDHVNQTGAMQAEDIADTIVFIVSRPARMNFVQVLVKPTSDAAAI